MPCNVSAILSRCVGDVLARCLRYSGDVYVMLFPMFCRWVGVVFDMLFLRRVCGVLAMCSLCFFTMSLRSVGYVFVAFLQCVCDVLVMVG